MKALVKKRPEKGLWLEDVSVPESGENDVLIRVQSTAICGTDVHIYHRNLIGSTLRFFATTVRCVRFSVLA